MRRRDAEFFIGWAVGFFESEEADWDREVADSRINFKLKMIWDNIYLAGCGWGEGSVEWWV